MAVSVNTDTRTMTNVTLTQEYERLHQVFGWQKEHFFRCNLGDGPSLRLYLRRDFRKRSYFGRDFGNRICLGCHLGDRSDLGRDFRNRISPGCHLGDRPDLGRDFGNRISLRCHLGDRSFFGCDFRNRPFFTATRWGVRRGCHLRPDLRFGFVFHEYPPKSYG